ncbi:hypothetical protein JCM11641_006536 [Rhodosporidiobolus odoratus]
MVRTSFLVASTAVFAAQALAAPSIQSPALYTCTPASYQYTCDAPPCTVVIRPADDAATSIASLGQVNEAEGAISWSPNVAEGTSVTAYITNAAGQVGNNSPTSVASGTTDCIGASSLAGGDSSSASSSAAASSSGSSSATGSSAASSASSSSGASRVSSISSAASSAVSTATAISSSSDAAASASASADPDSGAGKLAAGGLLAGALAVVAALA